MEEIQINRNFDKILRLASKGDITTIKDLLRKYPQILNKPSGGHNRTILWEAVNRNRMELVEYLIKRGADVNIPGRYRAQTFVLLKPYCIAHRNKKHQLKSILLANGHEMDIFSLAYLGDDGEIQNIVREDRKIVKGVQKEDVLWQVTPLHYAIAGNNLSTVITLLDYGAEVTKYSKLLYEIACRNNRLDIVQTLTKYGGVPNEVDVYPVFYHNNIKIIEYFIDNGLDCDKLLGHNWPPIVYLCRGDKGEHPQKIGQLVRYVKNINAQTPGGVSAMHAASKAGYLSVARILLDNGCKINIRDNRGKTPLHYSRKYKRVEMEAFLIKNGAVE